MSKINIIGAGIGGLTAGNLLAKQGHNVTIFESHSTPGGYIAGFWRKGFYFESGTLSFELSHEVFKVMKEIGVFDKVRFVKHEPFRIMSQYNDAMPASYQEYKQMVYKAYPTEHDRLDRYFAQVDPTYQAIKSLTLPGMMTKIAGGLKMLWLYLKLGNVTSSQLAARYFEKGTPLYRGFEHIGYPDMPALMIGGALWMFIDDYWTVADGMQSWADALAENFQRFGGELKLKSPVEKILTKEGTAVGVRCNGTDYPADYVISASDYKKTFLNLLDRSDVPDEFYEKVARAEVSEGFFVVYLGLNISNEALKKIMKSSYVMYNEVSMDVDVYDTQDERFFEKTSFGIYAVSMKNPKLAPEGKTSVMIFAVAPTRWMNNWGGDDRETYKRLKKQAQAALIEQACAVIPNLKELIEYQDAATPLTFERYTQNTLGATSAWSWNPKKRFYKNMFTQNIKTPVKNLLISSGWANEFGGIPGPIQAAQACVKVIQKGK